MPFTSAAHEALLANDVTMGLYLRVRCRQPGLDAAGVPLMDWTMYPHQAGGTLRWARGSVPELQIKIPNFDPVTKQKRTLRDEAVSNRLQYDAEVQLIWRVYTSPTTYEERTMFHGTVLNKHEDEEEFTLTALGADNRLLHRSAVLNTLARDTGRLLEVGYRPLQPMDDDEDPTSERMQKWAVKHDRLLKEVYQADPDGPPSYQTRQIDNLLAYAHSAAMNPVSMQLASPDDALVMPALPPGEYMLCVCARVKRFGHITWSAPAFPVVNANGEIQTVTITAGAVLQLDWQPFANLHSEWTLEGYDIFGVQVLSSGTAFSPLFYSELDSGAPSWLGQVSAATHSFQIHTWSPGTSPEGRSHPPKRREPFAQTGSVFYGFERNPAGSGTGIEYWQVNPTWVDPSIGGQEGIVRFRVPIGDIYGLVQEEITGEYPSAVYDNTSANPTSGARNKVGRFFIGDLKVFDRHTPRNGDSEMANFGDIIYAALEQDSPDGVGALPIQLSLLEDFIVPNDLVMYDPVSVPSLRARRGQPVQESVIDNLKQRVPAEQMAVGFDPTTGLVYAKLFTQKVQEDPLNPGTQIRDYDFLLHHRAETPFSTPLEGERVRSSIVATTQRERPRDFIQTATRIDLLGGTLKGAQTVNANAIKEWREGKSYFNVTPPGHPWYIRDPDYRTSFGWTRLPRTENNTSTGLDPFGHPYPLNYNAPGGRQAADEGYFFIPFDAWDLMGQPLDGNGEPTVFAGQGDVRVGKMVVVPGFSSNIKAGEGRSRVFFDGEEILVAKDADITNLSDFYNRDKWKRPAANSKRDDLPTAGGDGAVWTIENLIHNEFRWVLRYKKPFKDEGENLDSPSCTSTSFQVYEEAQVEVIAALQCDDPVRGFYGGYAHAIVAVAAGGPGTGIFEIGGDYVAAFPVGRKFRVEGSTGNDGDYTVLGAGLVGPNTQITVAEAVPDATPDGNFYEGPYAAIVTQLMGPDMLLARTGRFSSGHRTEYIDVSGELSELATEGLAEANLEDRNNDYLPVRWTGRLLPVTPLMTLGYYDHRARTGPALITFDCTSMLIDMGGGGVPPVMTVEGTDYLAGKIGAT